MGVRDSLDNKEHLILSCGSCQKLSKRGSMKLEKIRIGLVWFLMTLFIIFPCHTFAQDSQPAVAIKKPLLGEGVGGRQVKHLNLNSLWTEMENSLRDTRKFRVLSRNKTALKAIVEEQEFAASDLAKGDAAQTGQFNNANYLVLSTVQDFKFYRKHTPVPNFDDKYKRMDVGLLQVSAQMFDTTSGQLMTTFSLKTSFSTKSQIVNGRKGGPSSVHFSRMAKKNRRAAGRSVCGSLVPHEDCQTKW